MVAAIARLSDRPCRGCGTVVTTVSCITQAVGQPGRLRAEQPHGLRGLLAQGHRPAPRRRIVFVCARSTSMWPGLQVLGGDDGHENRPRRRADHPGRGDVDRGSKAGSPHRSQRHRPRDHRPVSGFGGRTSRVGLAASCPGWGAPPRRGRRCGDPGCGVCAKHIAARTCSLTECTRSPAASAGWRWSTAYRPAAARCEVVDSLGGIPRPLAQSPSTRKRPVITALAAAGARTTAIGSHVGGANQGQQRVLVSQP